MDAARGGPLSDDRQQALVARAAQLDLQRLQQWQFIVED